MTISTYVCAACTTGSIAQLGNYQDAEAAMLTFCNEIIGVCSSRYFKSNLMRPEQFAKQLESFYVFTAGPEEPGHGHSKLWIKYGTEFAQFIIDNNLGKIATLGKKLNIKYHPTTTCQTWLWSPDAKALLDWYKKKGDPNNV